MLKVLHFYKTYYPDSYGGIEQVIFQLCEGSAAQDVQSTVLALSPRGTIDCQSYFHHKVAYSGINFELSSTPFSLKAISDFKRLAAQADVIHYHFPYPFMDMMHFLVGSKKPTVVTYHSDIVKQKRFLKIYKPLMYRFLGSVDHIVASSPNYIKSSPVLQRFLPKVSVIPFGLDKASYPVVDEQRRNAWRERIGERFFLFIGAFRYYKGLPTLLEAMAIARYPLVLIGVGPMEAELKKYVTDRGLKNIHFLGAVNDEDKVALLELCYSVVFPSHLRSEAFGITLLEGAMYGKPLITCEIGTGTKYVNIHKETGLVVPPSDHVELADAMRQLWINQPLAAHFGHNALVRFHNLFTSNRMVDSYVSLYRRLIAKS